MYADVLGSDDSEGRVCGRRSVGALARMALVAFTAIGCANTCFVHTAQAQGPTQVVQMSAESVITFGQLARMDGITFCQNKQVISYIQVGLDSLEQMDVAVHEAKHREQFARFPSCAAFNAYYKTPVGRLESEAEAYVAGYCVAIKHGADPISLKGAYIRNLYQLMGGATMPGVILEVWAKYDRCNT